MMGTVLSGQHAQVLPAGYGGVENSVQWEDAVDILWEDGDIIDWEG